MFKLGIIIVHFENDKDTLDCLESFNQFAYSPETGVLVVDNSEIKLLDHAQLKDFSFPITLIHNHKNLGFAAAVNLGIDFWQKREVPFYLLLNNDIVLTDYSIQTMLNVLEKNPKVEVAGGMNYYYHSRSLWQGGLKNNSLTGATIKVNSEEEIFNVDYVPGSVFMARTGTLRFDENYFMYYEENDYCQQAHKLGQEVVMVNNTCFLHKTDGRDRKNSPFMFYYLTRNGLYFHRKNSRLLSGYPAIICIISYNLARSVKFELLNRNKRLRFLFFKSYFYALKHFFTHRWGRFPSVEL